MARVEGMSSPSISIRQYIRWMPDALADEPTSTLVLTTSRNHYVDTRVLVPQDIRHSSVLPRTAPTLQLSHLDWAFAGTSSSTLKTRRLSAHSNKSISSVSAIKPLTPTGEPDKKDAVVGGSRSPSIKPLTPTGERNNGEPESGSIAALKPLTPTDKQDEKDKQDEGSNHTRSASGGRIIKFRECTWTHWVDSRRSGRKATTSEDHIDSATLWPTKKENESLEKGQMLNNKGVLQDMEELWRDFKPQRLPGESQIVSVVLTAENPVMGTKGMVIRLGGWCQGVICSGSDIGVERWRYGDDGFWDGIVKRYDDSPAEQRAGGTWQKIFKLGTMALPCELACTKRLAEGDSLTYGGLKWTVVEHELL